jgi:hypothetical protein
MYNAPLFPFEDEPVLSTRNPLSPLAPALAVCKIKLPLVEPNPSPDTIETFPPVAALFPMEEPPIT